VSERRVVRGIAVAVVVASLAAVVGSSAAGAGTRLRRHRSATTAAAPPVAQPFSPTSPWYTVVPDDAPVVDDGDRYGHEIASEIAEFYGHASLNTSKYAPTVVKVGADQPTVTVQYWNCQNKTTPQDAFAAQVAAVPLPDDTPVPTDSDAHVAVWQPATDTVWELWKTRHLDGQWQACWGGRLDSASTSNGTFPFPYGGTATGISTLAGLVTPEELARGEIDHALAIGVVRTALGTFVSPANRTDGKTDDPAAIPEGQRLRLDPGVDVSKLPLTPLGRMVALALQRYGAIVRDTSGSVSVYAQNTNTWLATGAPDPYVAYYGGKPKWAQLDGIPWARLQTLPPGSGP
jgi:hypothetical protein